MPFYRSMGGASSRFRTVRTGAYKNPFFKRTPKQGMSWGTILRLVLILIVVTAGGVFFFKSPWFRMTKIEIKGLRLITQQEVENVVNNELQGEWWYFIPKNNFAFVPMQRINRKLQENYPFSSVEINRRVPGLLRISVVEREPKLFVTFYDTYKSVIDSEGLAVFTAVIKSDVVATTSTPEGERGDLHSTSSTTNVVTTSDPQKSSVAECTFCDTLGNLPHIMVSSTPPLIFNSGSRILPATQTGSILTIIGLFTTHSLPIKQISIDADSPTSLDISLVEGFRVYIDTERPVEPQFDHFNAFLTQKFPKSPRPFKYIDVRYGNKIYYQ